MTLHFYEQYGNFNWCDKSDYETQWYVAIKNDDGSTLVVDGKKCQLFWSEEGDQRGNYGIGDGLDVLAEQSFKYSRRIISSTDHTGETLAFVRAYNLHKEEIARTFEEKRKKGIQEEIKDLERKLQQTVLDGDVDIDKAYITADEQKRLKQWIASSEEKLAQYKDGSPAYMEEIERTNRYRGQLERLLN